MEESVGENVLLAIILVLSIVGLGFSWYLSRWVMAQDTGPKKMQDISNAIKEGAEAFVRRQYRTIILLALMLAIVLFLGYGFLRERQSFDPVQTSLELAMWVTISFILGAICSVIAGFVGMWISIRANIRTAVGAM